MRKLLLCTTIICMTILSVFTVFSETNEVNISNYESSFYDKFFKYPPTPTIIPTVETTEPTESTEPTSEPTEPPTQTDQPTVTEPRPSTEPTMEPVNYFYKQKAFYSETGKEKDGWILINAGLSEEVIPLDFTNIYGVFGNRVLIKNNINYPFELAWGVYDISTNTWYDLCTAWDDTEKFPKLHEYYESLNIGTLIGDLDNDNVITIVDATIIQKCLIELKSWPQYDEINKTHRSVHGKLEYLSDFNRDNNRDIMDASSIQKYIANID